MKTSFATLFVLSGLIASSVATPATRLRRQATAVCASGTPNCCDVDVLGIADLDCAVRKSSSQLLISTSLFQNEY
jgi:hypothetical protein